MMLVDIEKAHTVGKAIYIFEVVFLGIWIKIAKFQRFWIRHLGVLSGVLT